ncbi:MAG TPA: hypothetical protein PKU78_06420 [Candidatus Dojkabacteria bacterium]|nr:hypothetical protein [Candidatus Dojkabacteria bacterium]
MITSTDLIPQETEKVELWESHDLGKSFQYVGIIPSLEVLYKIKIKIVQENLNCKLRISGKDYPIDPETGMTEPYVALFGEVAMLARELLLTRSSKRQGTS